MAVTAGLAWIGDRYGPRTARRSGVPPERWRAPIDLSLHSLVKWNPRDRRRHVWNLHGLVEYRIALAGVRAYNPCLTLLDNDRITTTLTALCR